MQFSNVINGECRAGSTTERGVNPRTEEQLWEAPVASAAELDEAVAAARKAFVSWSVTTTEERAAVLVKIAGRIGEHAEELQGIFAAETGKSVSAARFPWKCPGC
ncbi:aldehyde dehydrogenase family protein [Candidatus Bathyarchaeota archaeon]|nr:aldehyde dehydrogenase family protein [Candidatus Bathyarchaeota archaeon]